MAHRDKRRWGIDPDLLEDMWTVFTTATALVAALRVTAPTWKRITDRKGVKEATAIKLVKEFFLLLRDVGDKDPVSAGAYRKFGLDMLDKYRDDIVHHRFKKFVVDVVEVAPAVQADLSIAVSG